MSADRRNRERAVALRILFVSMAALLAGSFLDYARADVGYVCDGNVVVIVAPGELERMKRENACVASHHQNDLTGKAANISTTVTATPATREASATPTAVTPAGSQPEAPTTVAGLPVVGLRGVQQSDEAPSRLMMFASGNVRIINTAPRLAD